MSRDSLYQEQRENRMGRARLASFLTTLSQELAKEPHETYQGVTREISHVPSSLRVSR